VAHSAQHFRGSATIWATTSLSREAPKKLAFGETDCGATWWRSIAASNEGTPSSETAGLVAPLRGTFGAEATRGTTEKHPNTVDPGVAVADVLTGTTPGVRQRVTGRKSPWLRRTAAAAAATMIVIVSTWNLARAGMTPIIPTVPSDAWRLLRSGSGMPHARHHARFAMDSSGEGALVIGGASLSDGHLSMEPIGKEVWRLIGLRLGAVSQWLRVPIRPGPAPSPRWMFGAAYDPSADRWFVHGGAQGWSSPCANDTWVLDQASGVNGAPAWRQVRVRGELPPPRGGFELVLDQNRRKLILFGGNDCVNLYLHDTWTLSFDDSTFSSGAWSRVLTDSSEGQPVMRTGYAAIYDTATTRLFVFGGVSQQRQATTELWVLDHADGESGAPRWRPLRCAGDPPWLAGSANAYDSARDRWSFFGGGDEASTPRHDLWRLDGLVHNTRACRWSRAQSSEPWPLARVAASAVTLPGGGGFLLFGGQVEQFSVADSWVLGGVSRR
jgi:hypothetical protein